MRTGNLSTLSILWRKEGAVSHIAAKINTKNKLVDEYVSIYPILTDGEPKPEKAEFKITLLDDSITTFFKEPFQGAILEDYQHILQGAEDFLTSLSIDKSKLYNGEYGFEAILRENGTTYEFNGETDFTIICPLTGPVEIVEK